MKCMYFYLSLNLLQSVLHLNSFFSRAIIGRSKLDSKIQNFVRLRYKEHSIKEIGPPSNSVVNVHNLIALKSLW